MALTAEEIKNLSRLFLSKDDDNTRLAFEILEPNGFVQELLTEIFVVYKLTKVRELRFKAEDLLKKQDSPNIIAAMNRKLEFNTEKTIKKNIKKYVDTSKGELDGLKFARALYNKYNLGLAYLMKEGSREEKIEILKEHIEGKKFKLNHGGLTAMPNEFYEFTDLEEIDISKNKITNLSGKFKAFTKLRRLNASSNCIKKVHKSLSKLTALEYLNLNRNLVEAFPEALCSFKSLRTLKMASMLNISGHVRGVEVPDEFENLQLTYLELSSDLYNGHTHGFSGWPYLKSIQAEEGSFLGLSPLAMAKTYFEQGGKASVYFLLYHAEPAYRKKVLEHFYDTETKTMDLSNMYIKYIPEEIGEFDIEVLNMKGCKYAYNFRLVDSDEEATKNFGLLSNLREIYLGDNGFNEIPQALFQCSQLRILDLNKNSVKAVSVDIVNLKELEYLGVEGSWDEVNFADEISAHPSLKKIDIGALSFKSKEETEAYKVRLKQLFEGTKISINRYMD